MMELDGFWMEVRDNALSILAIAISIFAALFAWSQKRQEMRVAWIRDLVSWAHAAMTALSRAEVAVARFPSMQLEAAESLRADLKAQLSASLDQGRLFFENDRARRPDLLDPLMRAIRLLDADPANYAPGHFKRCMSRHRTEFWLLTQTKINTAWLRKSVGGMSVTGGDGAGDFDNPDLPERLRRTR